jgi:hypothetical protein
MDISFNTYGTADFYSHDRLETDADLKPYRLWARFAGMQFEMRGGLQKINFGSATLFRPLRWFDTLDPRDPLKLTDGVYALLLRYYFQNNMNIWLWSLYGNEDPKGWEIVGTEDGVPEFGGRLQLPISTGEAALSCHHRRADFSYAGDGAVEENRLALDGKWDIGIGLWFEGSLVWRRSIPGESGGTDYQRMLTLGTDYTFDIGNGLAVLAEFFHSEGTDFIGASVNYPLGLLDEVSGIYNRDLTNEENSYSLRWQRCYDNWILHLSGFMPEKKIQVMIVYNY